VCGGGARLRVLSCCWFGGEANEMEQREADAVLRVKARQRGTGATGVPPG
jgi:hypothetical protein